ncbi:hypothetical protein ACFVFQ_25255 [Streptomyces sp. NPDC057743]|uniref:hypothetical protein n=1 Tax=Streptomyces sp. NPDC057743 TaxID=3346236 RepID=UPI0036973E06
MVVERGGMPRFLPDGPGIGRHGLAAEAPESVPHRDDLGVHGSRIAWAARRP